MNNIYFPFRSSNVPAKRKIKPGKADAPGRLEDERSCSESESSNDDYEDSEYTDDDNDDDSGTERCCTPRGSQAESD